VQIETVDELALSPEDDRQIADLLAQCFDTDFGDRSYFVQPQHRRYIMRDATIIGHIGVTHRLIRNGATLVRVVCVGDVAADPHYRGQGIASALLTHAIQDARTTMAQFIALFGTAGLYAGHGFQMATNPLRFVDSDAHQTRGVDTMVHPSFMIFPLTDLPWDTETDVDLLGHKF